MTRGFTFLELLITISVLSILLAVAAPSFSSVSETVKMQRLAAELNGFMMQAKSEAVMRNTDLWAHFLMNGNSNDTGDWKIELTEFDVPNTGTAILTMEGGSFRNVDFTVNYSSEQIKFSGVNGKAKDGHLLFDMNSKPLKLITYSASGRMRICGVEGDFYGYQPCT
ncbi:GspH/FimT family pseudopilin [Vibrio sp. Sgm 22]|uniref:GspH/FimT family pseudopilin n=1 Tax=unclassified Vibrio TaxID=2614977 RepID=UPI002248C31B|nr:MULTISPECIES: GspH/FimT family pseudopilin [unclassified Vibrio]MCX2758993.1 GspH/FimT family pseudopilin [Vibrio sp. 14G-20]MCX2774453.1 GspH/FimT family pseudopilin [Vibrio sp. Sgm 22]